MLISTLLSLALVAPAPQATAPAPGGSRQATSAPTNGPTGGPSGRGQARGASRAQHPWQAPPVPRRGIFGEPLPGQGSGQIGAAFGGSATRLGGNPARVTAIPAHQVTQITFNDPAGTGWQESCLVGVPSSPLANAPLLVMYHSYGVSEWDCYLNSPIFKLAMDRGWYVVAPLGAHQLNFGIPYSQANIEFVLDWMAATFPIDPNRVYGVGFSMGGGGLTSYMARHLDPNHVRFAAVVNHTGGVSIANTYWNSTDTSVFDNVAMFQGSPAQYPFAYSQVSMIDLDFVNGTVDPATDMARNAAHIPLLDFYVSQDPLAYLRAQVLALHTWMQAIPSLETLLEVPGTTHEWINLDAFVAIDFLRQKTLQVPRAGTHRVLADREARWHHFYVYQDAPGAFTPFRWTMFDALNRVVIDQTLNLDRIVIDSSSLGLHTSVPLEVVFGTQDGSTDRVTIDGYPNPPLSVMRGSQPTSSWSWDAASQAVTLVESNAANYPRWTITP